MTKHITTLVLISMVSIAGIAADISTDHQLEDIKKSQLKRQHSKYYGLATYSPLDLLIPSKLGATIGYIENKNTTWELEYLSGSVSAPFFFTDIGEMTDQRISLLRRSFLGTNSFYISYGLSYMNFSTKLGSEYLSSVSGGYIPEIDLLSLRSLGAQFSIGNQWHLGKNVLVGVDWVGLYQPLLQLQKKNAFVDATSDPELRKDVEDVIDAVSRIPRLTFFKLQIGASF